MIHALEFSGVIFNRIGSPRHRSMIEHSLAIPAFGYIPRKEELAVESRHLGLKMAHESENMGEFGTIIEESCDLDALVAAARSGTSYEKNDSLMIFITRKMDVKLVSLLTMHSVFITRIILTCSPVPVQNWFFSARSMTGYRMLMRYILGGDIPNFILPLLNPPPAPAT